MQQSAINKTVIIQTLEFFSPILIVPGLSNGQSKSKAILRDFVEVPFFVRLTCRILRKYSSYDSPSYSESNIEHRSNSFHYSSMTKPSEIILNDDASRKSGRD